MPFPCFDLCVMAWRESETVFHGTVVGAVILDCFATGVFLDDLEVDAFLFGIVTIISLTDFDSRGWNAGRRLVADDYCSAGMQGVGWLRMIAARLELAGTRLLVQVARRWLYCAGWGWLCCAGGLGLMLHANDACYVACAGCC